MIFVDIVFNLIQKKKNLCHEKLTVFLLMMTQEAFVESLDQDQTAQNMQCDLRSTLFRVLFQITAELFLNLAMEVIFSQ